MDYLHPKLDDAAIARMSSLALAHVGDAVYEILVRTHLACGGTQTAKNLHSQTIMLVRASRAGEGHRAHPPGPHRGGGDRLPSRPQRQAQDRAQVGNGRGVRPCDRARGAVRLAVSQAEI